MSATHRHLKSTSSSCRGKVTSGFNGETGDKV